MEPKAGLNRHESTGGARSWLLLVLAGPVAVAVFAGQVVAPAAAGTPIEVPVAAAVAPLPDPAVLSARLRKVSTAGIGSVGLVVTTTDETVLADRSGGRPLTPASTMKVLTAMAAVDILGPERTFATRVLDAGDGVVLVGGGDPLLTAGRSTSADKPASLQNLARATAAALKTAGRTVIGLHYDASLFVGPTFSPAWKAKWRGHEARVAALEINSGKLGNGRATADPPRTAAKAFAKRLRTYGIKVTSIAAGRAGLDSAELARVTSTSLSRIVERTLRISDNVAAETLLRHAAIASGRAGSFAGASTSLRSWLGEHGLWAPGQRILDGSGLAPGSKLTAAVLAAAIRLALASDEFAAIIAGLPVAGESGTLRSRFDDPTERAGRHTVHAKTGTLSRVAGLAGFLTTADGSVLVFAELGSHASSYHRVYNWLDRSAAVMARCGCR